MAKTSYKDLNLHLNVLAERIKSLKKTIKYRKKMKQYNASDPARVLRKIKSAKRQIADAGFI